MMIAGMCAVPSLSQAATPYVSAYVGLGLAGNSSFKDTNGTTVSDAVSYKTGIPFGGAIGLKGDQYRVEAALGYVTNDIDKVLNDNGVLTTDPTADKISIFSYMANAYYDYAIKDSSVTPYVMGGIGGASLDPQGPGFSGATSKSVFAWQLGAGVGVKAADNIVVDLGYRYFKPGSYKNDNGSKVTFSASNILLGLRYSF